MLTADAATDAGPVAALSPDPPPPPQPDWLSMAPIKTRARRLLLIFIATHCL
jgi:hypothetical protein